MEKYSGKNHTFVVCAYKESKYLEGCVKSLLNQSVRSNVKIATSTPNSFIMQIAEKYKLQLYVNSISEGIASDWNFALKCADTSLVTLAHQDDIYCKNYVKDMLGALNACQHPLIGFTDYNEIRGSEIVEKNKLLYIKRMLLMPLRIRGLWKNRFVRRRILSLGSAICCPSVTLVKENLQEPVFQNNMKSNIDWQAWEKISREKGEFVYIPKASMQHRIHQSSTTSKLLAIDGRKEEDLLMYRKFWPKWIAEFIEFFYQKSEKSNNI